MSGAEGRGQAGTDAAARRALVVAAVAARAGLTPSDVRPEHDLRDDLGLDSISLVELGVELARRLGLRDDALEAPGVRRVEDLAAQVERALAAGA